jgi:hypothetical protein
MKSFAKLIRTHNMFNLSRKNFSSQYDLTVPTINLNKFMNKSQGWDSEAKLAAECIHDTGILVVKNEVNKMNIF